MTGATLSSDFPRTRGAFQTAYQGNDDAFVTKLNATGNGLVYSTYLGGSGDDFPSGIAVDAGGNAYVTGSTNSTNFPTANPFQAIFGGGGDAFVTKLNAAGSAVMFSTYLGGNGSDYGSGIAVDPAGNAYVTGGTNSANFPLANPAQTFGGGGDAFVTKLNAAGSAVIFSTYLGGNGTDDGVGIAVDPAGNAYVTGNTYSTNFPTANPVQATLGGGPEDAFVTKVNAAGSAIMFSTYLGGSGNDRVRGITVDAGGNAYVTGQTNSTNFPVTNPFQATFAGGVSDAFIAKIFVPAAAGDFDGDGRADVAVWRPSNGTWFVIPSASPGSLTVRQWGANGDIPVREDYDGDGVTDIAVFRPSSGTWFILPSSKPGTFTLQQWGTNEDIPVPGDYDRDGKTDLAVFRPSLGMWFIVPSANSSVPILQQWGTQGDIPVPGDYDRDGKTDIAVWRPSNGTWYIIPSSTPTNFTVTQWGTNGDVPAERPVGQ